MIYERVALDWLYTVRDLDTDLGLDMVGFGLV
jgi:hypothetical protein